ncbi:hypothetical protein ACJ41O_007106 [Fusarium nematophilum]
MASRGDDLGRDPARTLASHPEAQLESTPSPHPPSLAAIPSPGEDGTASSPEPEPNASLLLKLPPELIDAILSNLPPWDLATVSGTCHSLRKHAVSDVLWHPLVQENVPGAKLSSPGPCDSYQELYAIHDRFWFLPRHKIWFCDRDLVGKVILVRYDPRRGCIEGYQLLATRSRPVFANWPDHAGVTIHEFHPQVKLHLDKPVVQFRSHETRYRGPYRHRPDINRFEEEIPMNLDERLEAMYSNFILARSLDPEAVNEKLDGIFPYDYVWPPPAVPSSHRVSGGGPTFPDGFVQGPIDRPQKRAEVSDQAFRIRHWMEMGGNAARLGPAGGLAGIFHVLRGVGAGEGAGPGLDLPGIHIGEELITYSTLDPKLYTPTALKPWRGIWVGDYSGHGCEFLLIHQPDDPPATDEELGLSRLDTETDKEWDKRKVDTRIHRGRLEAIKLTGDPNVPRGERTFIVDDLGPGGLVEVASDSRFVGTRIVRSKGHVADTGFLADRFVESQLLLISHDRLAQHWVGFGHVSFFERVDMDQLLSV